MSELEVYLMSNQIYKQKTKNGSTTGKVKLITIALLLSFSVILISSCSKDDKDDDTSPADKQQTANNSINTTNNTNNTTSQKKQKQEKPVDMKDGMMGDNKHKNHSKSAINIPVKTVTVLDPNYNDILIPVEGELTPLNAIMLKAEASGRIEKINVQKGSQVKAGDVIVTLNKTDCTLQLQTKERDLNFSKTKYEQYKALYDRDAISKNDFMQMEKDYLNLEDAYNQTKMQCEKQSITSTIDGIVSNLYIQNVSTIANGAQVAEIMSTSTFKLLSAIPKFKVINIKPNQPFIASVRNPLSGEYVNVTGNVSFVSSQIEPISHSYNIEVLVDPNAKYNNLLHAGDIMTGYVKSASKFDGVAIIPLRAIQNDKTDYIYKVGENDTAKRVNVTVIDLLGDNALISLANSNLHIDDEVIVEGQYFIQGDETHIIRQNENKSNNTNSSNAKNVSNNDSHNSSNAGMANNMKNKSNSSDTSNTTNSTNHSKANNTTVNTNMSVNANTNATVTHNSTTKTNVTNTTTTTTTTIEVN